MDIGTHTQVATVSKIKMATAFLFLGGAALAASAAGGLAGRTPKTAPDLVIKSIFLETNQEPQGKGGGPTSGYDVYTIIYENIGNAPVTKPFNIMVQSSPAPYQTWGAGDPVMYLATNNAVDGNGYSGGFPELVTKPAAPVAGTTLYTIPVSSPNGDSDLYPGLNMYKLNGVSNSPNDGWSGGIVPGDIGQIKVYISKFYQDMLGKGGKSKVGAYVDYVKTNKNGAVVESNEINNEKTVNFDKSSYSVVPSNLCTPDYIVPELAKDICKTQGGSFICIDKYTKWYSACVPAAADCAKKIKTTVPCEVDLAGGQPYFDTIEVGIGGAGWERTKTFTNISYALGKYSTNNSDLTTLYYPYEKKDENKMVRFKITAKNAGATSTVYGFFQEGKKGLNYSVSYPGDSAMYSGFTSLFKNSVAWSSATNSKFFTSSGPIVLYLGVKNNDTTYFGFPNTKVADDAIVLQIMPEPAPAPASQPPTSTSESGSNNPPTTTVSNDQPTLSVTINPIQPMIIQPSSNQLVGDFNFTANGGSQLQVLCLKGIRSQVISSPANAIQFGKLLIHQYANPSPGYQFSSAFGSTYFSNGVPVFDFDSKGDYGCLENNGSTTRLQFFLNDVTFNPQPYPATLLHKLMDVSYTNQKTGQNGTIYPVLSNGSLEAKPFQQ